MVVVRDKPFHRSEGKWEDLPEEPPLPPIVITAYTVSDSSMADKKYKENKRRWR